MIKAVFIDIDDTLLNSERKVTENTKKKIEQCINNGIKIILASGRSRKEAIKLQEEIGTSPLIISSNGASVYDKEKSKEIREKETKIQISQKALQKILPKQEMLSEKLKELKSNTDKKQNIEKDIKEGEKIEEKNKIKLLKINELKEILDTYKKVLKINKISIKN